MNYIFTKTVYLYYKVNKYNEIIVINSLILKPNKFKKILNDLKRCLYSLKSLATISKQRICFELRRDIILSGLAEL